MGSRGPGNARFVRAGRRVIAIDATPLTETRAGGVRRALTLLLQGLASLPDRPPVVLVSPRAPVLDVATLDGLHVPPGRSLPPSVFRRWALPRLLERLGARVLYVPFAATPRLPVPVVALVHELPHVRWPAIEGRARALRFGRATRLAARRASALCVPAHATALDLIRATGVASGRVHVTGNAFDPEPWATAQPEVPGCDVVAVGSGAGAAGGRKKGMDVLGEAAAALPDRAFQVVGEPTWPMPPNVSFRPALEDRALRRLVAGARLLVHPARSEGFGYPPLEAMAAGTPVVAAAGGALPDVLGDAALFVEPGDAAGLARAIRHLLDDASLREDLRERGRRRAQAFLPPVVARRVLDVLVEAAR